MYILIHTYKYRYTHAYTHTFRKKNTQMQKKSKVQDAGSSLYSSLQYKFFFVPQLNLKSDARNGVAGLILPAVSGRETSMSLGREDGGEESERKTEARSNERSAKKCRGVKNEAVKIAWQEKRKKCYAKYTYKYIYIHTYIHTVYREGKVRNIEKIEKKSLYI